jgi:hypothetical protein
MEVMGGTAQSRFFPLYPIRPVGRIFCSPEQSKLCFEMLEINSRTSKPLALSGSFKTPSEVGVYVSY